MKKFIDKNIHYIAGGVAGATGGIIGNLIGWFVGFLTCFGLYMIIFGILHWIRLALPNEKE